MLQHRIIIASAASCLQAYQRKLSQATLCLESAYYHLLHRGAARSGVHYSPISSTSIDQVAWQTQHHPKGHPTLCDRPGTDVSTIDQVLINPTFYSDLHANWISNILPTYTPTKYLHTFVYQQGTNIVCPALLSESSSIAVSSARPSGAMQPAEGYTPTSFHSSSSNSTATYSTRGMSSQLRSSRDIACHTTWRF